MLVAACSPIACPCIGLQRPRCPAHLFQGLHKWRLLLRQRGRLFFSGCSPLPSLLHPQPSSAMSCLTPTFSPTLQLVVLSSAALSHPLTRYLPLCSSVEQEFSLQCAGVVPSLLSMPPFAPLAVSLMRQRMSPHLKWLLPLEFTSFQLTHLTCPAP